MQKENPMSTDEENINTASIEEMINANLGIDATELEEASSEEQPEVDELIATEIPEDHSEAMPEEAATDEAEILAEEPTLDVLEQAEAINEEFEESVEVDNLTHENDEETASSELDNAEVDIDLNQPAEATITNLPSDTDESIEADLSADEANIEAEISEISTENDISETATPEVLNEEVPDIAEGDQTEPVPGPEPMLALETEVSELENEIQEQLDQFVEQADHLKSNIRSELQRVSSDNEQLQEQVSSLAQQLSDAEEKIQGFTEVQDKQQATIHKLILIIKGIRTKISHLYDED